MQDQGGGHRPDGQDPEEIPDLQNPIEDRLVRPLHFIVAGSRADKSNQKAKRSVTKDIKADDDLRNEQAEEEQSLHARADIEAHKTPERSVEP